MGKDFCQKHPMSRHDDASLPEEAGKKLCWQAKTAAELERIARELLMHHPNERIFAIYGEMGVGKTTFIKALCRQLGVSDIVSSPTFSIVNEYVSRNGERIFHFDFYRLQKSEEAFDLGYEEYFYSGCYCFLEWPAKISLLLPADAISVYMEDREGVRYIMI